MILLYVYFKFVIMNVCTSEGLSPLLEGRCLFIPLEGIADRYTMSNRIINAPVLQAQQANCHDVEMDGQDEQ